MNHYEIEACVIRAKNGNKEELLKILEQYKPFIFKTARQYNLKNFDLYDLVQLGYVSLINAVAKYRVGSHTFSSYAYNAIKNAYRFAARKNLKCDKELSLNTPIDGDENSYTEFVDCIENLDNLEEDIIKAETLKDLRKAVSKLPADEMELIIMVYFSKCSLKTYAEKKGLDYQYMVRKKNKILEKLRHHINNKAH